jgi:hypothetical protein
VAKQNEPPVAKGRAHRRATGSLNAAETKATWNKHVNLLGSVAKGRIDDVVAALDAVKSDDDAEGFKEALVSCSLAARAIMDAAEAKVASLRRQL